MKTVTTQTIKRYGAKAISASEPTYLIVNSQPKAVILPVNFYEELLAERQELADLKISLQRVSDRELTYQEILADLAESAEIEVVP